MKKIFLPFAAVALLLSSCKDAAPKEELVINLQEKGAEVASSMYGIFFEEINHAGDGGLYAELVKNRRFEELEMPEGYYAEGDVLHSDDGYDMTVTKVDGRRIETIEVRKAGAPDHAPVSAE